ncbi:MAG: hypothetical protein GX937_04525 [Lentisphaerae bacterium]|jgi:N-acetylglucosamine kinase-like BadF-type ATPase|nr:hypothetical protein [Lentisphaerota bacterium]
MAYVVGLDGGGSKCAAMLVDASGTVRGMGLGGSTHILYSCPEAVMESIQTAFSQACAGTSLTSDDLMISCGIPQELVSTLAQQTGMGGCEARSEYELGMAAAMKSHGILVLAGTGSVVYGGSTEGEYTCIGGQGPLFADEGSGFHIGQLGLRAAFRSHYNAKRRTILAQTLPALYGVSDLRELFTLLYRENTKGVRRLIARAAVGVNAAAEDGDQVAIGVLRRAACELALLLPDVVDKVNLRQADVPMVASGSVALNSAIYWREFCAAAARLAPNLTPLQPRLPPVGGAALLGLRKLGVAWTAELLDTMVQSYNLFGKQNQPT